MAETIVVDCLSGREKSVLLTEEEMEGEGELIIILYTLLGQINNGC